MNKLTKFTPAWVTTTNVGKAQHLREKKTNFFLNNTAN